MRSSWCLARGKRAQISLDAVRAVPETYTNFPKWKELLQNCIMCLKCFVLEEVWSPVTERNWFVKEPVEITYSDRYQAMK